jgi:beta-1,2-mannobiose phosphorylase / 1,2-beta-oligomannan phosphorylase
MQLLERFVENPIVKPKDLSPGIKGMNIECLLNPGVFTFEGKTWLIVRVAERPVQTEGKISFPILNSQNEIEIVAFDKKDKGLNLSDPRVIVFNGQSFLTTLSYLRLLCSEDGVHFHEPKGFPLLFGQGEDESFGIEDCRVACIGNQYHLTYTKVSGKGVGVGLMSTSDWKTFERKGMIFPPHNKDCALFEEKIAGKYYALHRPSSPELGGNYIWLSESPDLVHWGNHKCIATTRPLMWDSARIGAGASPVKTKEGWLIIYHGADKSNRYCLGAMLLDLKDPSKVIARSEHPIMEPEMEYEKTGFFGNVIFTNGHIVNNDIITMYYGASDEVICGARLSVEGILGKIGV